MGKQLHISEGSPLPLGASTTATGVNFSIFSRNAEAVSLVLSHYHHTSRGKKEIPLNSRLNRTGDTWHIHLSGLAPGFRYGYRIYGPYAPQDSGHAFDDRLILLDPYARQIDSSPWGIDKKYLGREPCCLLDDHPYDWEGDRPLNIALKDTIIYELHVRGFTRHPSSAVDHPGTFQGIIDKIPYLKELGITAVELMPVTEFDENEPLFINPDTGERHKNFWGYSPLSFFAPKAAYASAATQPLNEFRDMVKALHRAGIETILDIVYNHTAEGGVDGPTTSFRGIDNTIYYLLDQQTRAYLNFSGCGNTCNCNHPIVRQLIMDALRWWVVEMHVDGFRFDLASILGRNPAGQVLANPPVVEAIAEDPVLASTKIIAEAWDAAGLYQVGSFSTHYRWAEWNGRFRDDVRSFMCGHPGMVPALATRLSGSSDLYQQNGRGPCNSINFITSHDGFTLADLVAYNEKHNRLNGENNRDGDNHNLSWNSGAEGRTDTAEILELRSRRLRSMAVILFLSQGVPMLVAGDEFGRTQQGNNNAWCQDNDTSWLNWDLLEKNRDQHDFFRFLLHLRRQHPVFRRENFFPAGTSDNEPQHLREISWQGLKPGKQDWSYRCHTLAFLLNGALAGEHADDDFFIMLNGHARKAAVFTVPPPPRPHENRHWRKIIDTGQLPPGDAVQPEHAPCIRTGQKIRVINMAAMVLQSFPAEKTKTTGASSSSRTN
ncbi:MAG: glycogen debranching enzyme GlgX [Desulfobulbus propionicus]|nr:MAG: glycogen debranching enzyme GlgX [Desulfobulbus propionicus]